MATPPQSPPIDLLSQWSNADYWRKLCPYLTISSDDKGLADDNDKNIEGCDDVNLNEQLLERLIDDGYALLDSKICNDSLREKLARGISDMEVQHTLPATFILLYDETWKLAEESHRLLLQQRNADNATNQSTLHPNNMAFNFDMLAWHIDPRMNEAGFSPHRDRQPDSLSDLENSFYADGQAKYITHWIALTDATPENSCLYVIPKQYDPGYTKGDDDDPEAEVNANKEGAEDEKDNKDNASNDNTQLSDPLSRALDTKQSYQNIRALPRKAGQSLIFTHRILHWGSRGNRHALNVHPRIAISFVYSDVEFEAPYLSKESFLVDTKKEGNNWAYPAFSIRLLLVCAQLLIYYQRFDLSTSTLRACYEYCKSHSNQLDAKYQKKVFVEYVKAMQERRDGIPNVESNNQNENGMINDGKDDRANSDDEEALLEEMLNNSDEFEDDYDDMCDDGHDDGRKRKRDR